MHVVQISASGVIAAVQRSWWRWIWFLRDSYAKTSRHLRQASGGSLNDWTDGGCGILRWSATKSVIIVIIAIVTIAIEIVTIVPIVPNVIAIVIAIVHIISRWEVLSDTIVVCWLVSVYLAIAHLSIQGSNGLRAHQGYQHQG